MSRDPLTRGQVFEARVERWRPDLMTALGRLYADPEAVADRLLAIARAAYDARPDELHDLDDQRLAEPDWFQRPDALGYAAYADRFAGTLDQVADHADHLVELGVTYLHLMPLLTPRPAPNDGGYAVADYRSVRPDLGDVDDLRDLTTALRWRGISVCIDLVLNHTAREHAWAAAARAGDAEKRDYYLVFPDRDVPDQYELSLPEVFPDFAPGSFTWDGELDGWVWTTFNDYQWDLNWANPSVLCEFADILLGHANLGVEVFRLDAIAFLWKRMGTSCQNQPEVHDLTQALRTVARIAAPGRAVQGRGDRRAGRPPGLPRHGRPRGQGLRPRLPQQPDGAGLVDARLGRGQPGHHRPAEPAAAAVDDRVGHLHPLPRRHRLGHRRHRRLAGRAQRPRPPPVPRRLVRRRAPGLVGARAGVPGERGHRRPPDQRARSRRWPAASATTPVPSRASCSPTPWCWASAACPSSGWVTSSAC